MNGKEKHTNTGDQPNDTTKTTKTMTSQIFNTGQSLLGLTQADINAIVQLVMAYEWAKIAAIKAVDKVALDKNVETIKARLKECIEPLYVKASAAYKTLLTTAARAISELADDLKELLKDHPSVPMETLEQNIHKHVIE